MKISAISNLNGYNKNLSKVSKQQKNSQPSFQGNFKDPYGKGMLVILDGFGVAPEGQKMNPMDDANMPFYKSLVNNLYGDTLYRTIGASGMHVGLRDGVVGNSEAGHNTIGAGREVRQDLVNIDKCIEDGTFFENPALLKAMNHAKENNSTLHVMGLLSDGYVHSDTKHLDAIIKMAKENDVKDVRVHAFLDGRDVPEHTGITYVEKTNKKLNEAGYAPIASVVGMFYPMDRAGKFEKTEVAYDLLTGAETYKDSTANGIPIIKKFHTAGNVLGNLQYQYDSGIEDRNVQPIRTKSFKPIDDNDSVIFFNYRPDRARQLAGALTHQHACGAKFIREKRPIQNLEFVCMSQYNTNYDLPVAFKPVTHDNTLTQVLAENDFMPFLCTESEKLPHLTFFLDGKRNEHFSGANEVFLSSQKEFTPEMRLPQIEKQILTNLEEPLTKTIITNFSNGDMIGHTGNYEYGVETLEIMDRALYDVITKSRQRKAPVIITADHGNIENMDHNAAHTSNPVPFIVVLPGRQHEIKNGDIRMDMDDSRGLKDVAPSFLKI
ncbi:2,3-bisphosphoglycerate-independent phosphoglycerate mutase, partial [bacterium]|nr:2,3-bisphosphoglycerate-independent phosphoglycerate mutase [bacterium]